MSTDIQVISVVDDLQIISVEDIEGAEPRTLRLIGRGGFNSAQRVIINDYGINTFVVVTDTVLLVAPGDTFDSVAVEDMNLVVVSSSLTSTRRVRLFFGPTVRLKSVTGIQKLIQHIVKVLLTNVGTNRFRLQEGGNLLKLTSFPLTPASRPRIITALSQAVSSTETQIIAAQAAQRGLTLDERLLGLALGNVVFDDGTLEVQATIRLTTYRGRSVAVPLVL